ncbi:unnamed protein product [Rotaria sp. Silwood1]|nr:unnamed protein product [Rotaria sp. Silwood1]
MLGERLLPLIQQIQLELVGKITGMLLEIDNTELLHMLESSELLKAEVEQAIAILQTYQAKQAATNSAAQQNQISSFKKIKIKQNPSKCIGTYTYT